jgi:glycerophosphoryl diester phosphodiesterase
VTLAPPHPESIIRLPGSRQVDLKIHQCVWSGDYPANSLAAIDECYRAPVARAEIDVCLLKDADFLVVHELELEDSTNSHGPVRDVARRDVRSLRLLHNGQASEHAPPLLSEVVELIGGQPQPVLMELDIKERQPIPWPRVEELARMVEPVKDRVTLAGVADWNLRRLLHVDPSLPVGWDPNQHFDWVPERDDERPRLPRSAYGYLDAHPLGRQRAAPVDEYVWDRVAELVQLVPGLRELHLRMLTFERMLQDGASNIVDLVHQHAVLLDLWTLDADTPNWQARLQRALDAGVDIITTNTPRALSAAASASD